MGQLIAGPGTLASVVKKLPKKAHLTVAIAFISDPMGLPVKAGDRIYVNCLDSTIAGGATDPVSSLGGSKRAWRFFTVRSCMRRSSSPGSGRQSAPRTFPSAPTASGAPPR